MKPHQNQKEQSSESFQVNIWRFRESGVLGEGMEALRPFPITCPKHLFHLAAPELYAFLIN